jgi:hypothetical protein
MNYRDQLEARYSLSVDTARQYPTEVLEAMLKDLAPDYEFMTKEIAQYRRQMYRILQLMYDVVDLRHPLDHDRCVLLNEDIVVVPYWW